MNKTIENRRPVGSDWFKLMYSRRDDRLLKDHLKLFNPDDYYILKSSGKQRQVSYEEFLEFKWSSYIFFKKYIYDIDHINKWVEYLNKLGGIQFLDKPFPPFDPNKIKK